MNEILEAGQILARALLDETLSEEVKMHIHDALHELTLAVLKIED